MSRHWCRRGSITAESSQECYFHPRQIVLCGRANIASSFDSPAERGGLDYYVFKHLLCHLLGGACPQGLERRLCPPPGVCVLAVSPQ